MSTVIKILMVDDEPNILSGYKRLLGRKFNLVTAVGGQEGLKTIREQGPFAVVITDMRMPGMDGLEFLKAAQHENKRGVYAMLTGNADQETATNAINQGRIFRFLNKPCSNEDLSLAIEACIRQYELVNAEHLLLRGTVAGSIKLLTQTLSLSNPRIAQLNESIRLDTTGIAKLVGLASDWRTSIAGSLCLIGGAVAGGTAYDGIVPDETLVRHAKLGANLLRHIPKLADVAHIIEHQRDTGPMPDLLDLSDVLDNGSNSTRLTLCSRILRLAVDFRMALAECNYDQAITFEKIIAENPPYDERLLDAYRTVIADTNLGPTGGAEFELRDVPVQKLEPGMCVSEDVTTKDGKMLLAKGSTLTSVVIERLKELQITKLYSGELSVLVPVAGLESEAA